MGITSVSIIMTVIVLNFHYRGPVNKEMPKWLKKLILDKNIYKDYYKSSNNGSTQQNV
jgi:nicotinic acetylcholine receptor